MSINKSAMKIFTGNANRQFALDICEALKVPLGKSEVVQFSDGESNVWISETVRGYEIFLIQPTCPPVNDSLVEGLIMIDAFRRASAGIINAVIPYYGYARQDRKTRAREPITAKLVANLFEKAGVDRVLTMDLHAGQIQGYFDIPVDHLSGVKTLTNYFEDFDLSNFIVVSPDLGGVTRARNFANFLHLPIAIIEKRRPRPNECEVMHIIGDISGKNAIIVDDIIDTAGTITQAAKALKDKGAKDVYITATHGVFSGPAIERIENSVVEKCIVTDTIPLRLTEKCSKIDVVTVAPYFASAIARINNNESISDLFDAEGL